MTLHLAKTDVEAIGAEGDERPVALPEETVGPFSISAGERTVAASSTPIQSLREKLKRVNGAVLAASDRLRWKREQKGVEIEDEEPSLPPVVDADEGVADGASAELSSSVKPVWRRPAFIGAASAAAIAVATGAVLIVLSGEGSKQAQVAEVGLTPGSQGYAPLMAPAAALATVPQREASELVPSRPMEAGEKRDQLQEILSFKPDRVKNTESSAAPPAKNAGGDPPVEEAGKAGSAETAHDEFKTADPTMKIETQAASAPAPAEKKAEAVILETGSSESKPRIGNDADVRVASLRREETKRTAALPAPATTPAAPSVAPASAVVVDDAKKETEALALVTELGTLLREVKADVAVLKSAQMASASATESKINDFERRLSLSEAKRAIESVKAVGEAPGDAAQAKTPSAPGKPIGPLASGIRTASLKTLAPAAATEEQRRYRIQAASPGLAMLAEIDGPSDQEGPLQVAIGASIPGYGKVKSIDQRGAAWVVQTERGVIQ